MADLLLSLSLSLIFHLSTPEDTEYLVLAKHQYMGGINTYRSFVW